MAVCRAGIRPHVQAHLGSCDIVSPGPAAQPPRASPQAQAAAAAAPAECARAVASAHRTPLICYYTPACPTVADCIVVHVTP